MVARPLPAPTPTPLPAGFDDPVLLNQQMQELQRENDRLKSHVDRLQSDPNAIEHQAREELHYTRPGEVIYALPAK